MSTSIRKEIILDIQDVVREYYQDFLERFGFVSYQNDLIHWFMLRDDVLYSVQLQSWRDQDPIQIKPIVYAMPLYLQSPPVPLRIFGNDRDDDFCIWVHQKVQYHQNRTFLYFLRGDGGKRLGGDYVEEKVGQMLDEIHSPWDAFQFRKRWFYAGIYPQSESFLDELIYNQEKDQDPDYVKYCLKHLKTRLRSWLPLDRREEEPLERNFAYLPFESAGFAKWWNRYRALTDLAYRVVYLSEANFAAQKEKRLRELRRKIPALFEPQTHRSGMILRP